MGLEVADDTLHSGSAAVAVDFKLVFFASTYDEFLTGIAAPTAEGDATERNVGERMAA
jgi:hypothetical protein